MPQTVSRRSFLTAMMSTGIALQIPGETLGMFSGKTSKTKIGIITDLHQDIMHDGQERLEAFLTHMKKVNPDALLQMGDFAYPGDKNKTVIDLFNNAHSSRMHVIGNHDTDAGYTKQQCLDYWGMPARYYAKNINGICFIILDGNDKGSPNHKGGYASYINKEQADWLQQQLIRATDPVMIISHQPLAGGEAVDNAVELQKILSTHANKILLAINGHTHIDSHVVIDKVNYVHINSASYFWMGDKFKHKSYSEEVHKEHPWIEYTCPYIDALFTTLTIDPLSGIIKIEGRKSTWKGRSPKELYYFHEKTWASEKEVVPSISNRNIKRKNS
ncbi:metallophosphoesterase family protein [Niabella ginsengisoli]|uniref:Metallophosphoesterase n=1 Tax=Niabella ginsengisoli TaxID=522298 RepID=A0ABS9SIJ2_9BACT|nr:metallophosphoesterase [Niabella ginsengisoli]MCH5598183.1 metallophosphoesterase [Niabella ginsengisoli]